MTATITSKGQITIPLAIRKHLRLKPGDVLDFDEDATFLKARRVIDETKARTVLGCARERMKGKTVQQWLEWARGPVQLPRNAARRR
jgi:AbrB family looped-hinge helix DNA binding protein